MTPGRPPKKDVDGLLEIEQPERQAQISRREHLRLVAEAAAVFVVRIEQEDAQVRPRFENLLQDDGDAARLADAGGAEDGEMPAHQLIDVDVDGDIRILLQVADMGAIGVGRAIDQPQHVLGEHQRLRRRCSDIPRSRAGSARRPRSPTNLADQIEPRHPAEHLSAARRGKGFSPTSVMSPMMTAFVGLQSHEFSDGRRLAVRCARSEFDVGLRAADTHHATDCFGLRACRAWVGCNGWGHDHSARRILHVLPDCRAHERNTTELFCFC